MPRIIVFDEERHQFNAIEMQSASKFDFIVRQDRPFSREESRRRQRVDLPFAAGVAVVLPYSDQLVEVVTAQQALLIGH
jgi:hypothetical protein